MSSAMRMDWRSCLRVMLLCIVFAAPALGQQNAPPEPNAAAKQDEPVQRDPNAISPKTIQDQITPLEQKPDLDENGRAALDLLRKALVAVQAADDFAAKKNEFQQISQGVPDRMRDYGARLEQPIKETDVSAAPSMTAEQIRGEVSAAQAAVDTTKQARQIADQDATTRTQRREQIPQEIAALRQQLSDIEQRQVAPANGTDDPTLHEAQRLSLLADRKRLEQNIAMLEEELRSYDARRDTLRLRRQVAERDAQEADKRLQAWQGAMTAHEQAEAARLAQQAHDAQVAAEAVHPLVAELAETNRQYAKERTELVPKVEKATADLKDISATLQQLTDDFRSVKARVEQSGTTTTLGLLLRNKRASLPDIAEHERNLREREVEINRVQLLRSELDDELLGLVNVDEAADQLIRAHEGEIPADKLDTIREAVIEQLRRRKEEFIPGLIAALDAYLEDTLIRLDQAETQLVTLTEEYLTFVNERILWIRSANPVSLETATGSVEATSWLLSGRHWNELITALWNDVRSNWVSVALPLILILVLAGLQRTIRRQIDRIAGEIRSYRTDTFPRTLEALGLTALCVIVWPAFLWLLSTRIVYASDLMGGDTGVFGRATSDGILRVARFLLVALTLWYVCRSKGLGESHFHWRTSSLKLIRRNLIWLIPLVASSVFVLNVMEHQPNESFKASLGRLALLVLSGSVAVFLARVLKPTGGILTGYLARKRGGWIDRLRYVWFSIAVGTPIALAVASLAGYHYTAAQLGQVVFKTFALIISASILHALLIRWLLVAQRKLAMEQAKKRKAAQVEAAAATSASASSAPGAAPAGSSSIASESIMEEQEFDITAIGEQTRRLVMLGVWFALLIGIWGAWADVLPALGALRQVELTQQVQSITETAPAGDGTISVHTVDKLVPITLADLLLSFLVVGLTVLATRNIPGLLEITILQKLPLRPGGRYAVLTICRYIILIVGIVLAFSMIGIGWSKVQWLAAAITVGLGFGLQEIFANFVSGIIILFEQPIRVGDTVTINDISGTVTRIRMRATTIRDWDRKELVIPNKTFVTDRIVNWTLSDTVLRLRLPVGVAYGSNTELAISLLLQVARDNSMVLNEPKPVALFQKFGESSLDFELRVYIDNLDNMFEIQNELLHSIDQEFRKAGIEIAFPQRDLHIRSGLDVLARGIAMSQTDEKETK